ncbi:hypothetical protein CRENBAI_004626 [Crenichthys baileyi]|uniref:Uncharacterized protein n=1 Tax=Crenichthys baileyi TaxID=28760 RepID=A0AAV9S841_9TELE
MRPLCHDLHFGPATKPTTLTVGTSQEKDQAAGKEMITLWEYLRLRRHMPCAMEKGFIQARRGEELRSPFWGTRLAIHLPGTWYRNATLHLRPLSINPQSGIQLPPRLRNLYMAPHTSSARYGRAPRLHRTLPALPPAEDTATVRTLFLLLWRFGQAPPYPSRRVWPTLLPLAWRPRLHFLVPSLAPAITQYPIVAPGRKT